MSAETFSGNITHSEPAVNTYSETVQTLIDGSIRRNFDPLTDIPWDSDEYKVLPDDPRWILPSTVDLGKTDWYQEQSTERQIEIGQWRMADVAKTGLLFERMLVQAIMVHNVSEPNGSLDQQYSDLEAREELNHIMMFERLVDRIGVDTKGARVWFRKLLPLIVPAASQVKGGMWMVVLAGEEPIDHMQKELLRNGDQMHPLMRDIMAIHVAEEGRHISYAHQRLMNDVPKMSTASKLGLAAMAPAAMRTLHDVIVIPPADELAAMNVPEYASNQIWGSKTAQARRDRSDKFPDVRMLVENLDLKTPRGKKKSLISAVGDAAWKAHGVDGPSSRYRSEPNRTHSVTA